MRAIPALIGFLSLALATPAQAERATLGVYSSWGAFRENAVRRCYAISEPARRSAAGNWKPYVSILFWPERGVRSQFHFRFRYRRSAKAPVILVLGTMRVPLVASGSDAWAPTRAIDMQIAHAIRGGQSMRLEMRTEKGTAVSELYALQGVASAMDAAVLGCL